VGSDRGPGGRPPCGERIVVYRGSLVFQLNMLVRQLWLRLSVGRDCAGESRALGRIGAPFRRVGFFKFACVLRASASNPEPQSDNCAVPQCTYVKVPNLPTSVKFPWPWRLMLHICNNNSYVPCYIYTKYGST
jgi:hypothetical protein